MLRAAGAGRGPRPGRQGSAGVCSAFGRSSSADRAHAGTLGGAMRLRDSGGVRPGPAHHLASLARAARGRTCGLREARRVGVLLLEARGPQGNGAGTAGAWVISQIVALESENEQVKALLTASGLPLNGLWHTQLWGVLAEDGGVIGMAGFEYFD